MIPSTSSSNGSNTTIFGYIMEVPDTASASKYVNEYREMCKQNWFCSPFEYYLPE